MKTTIPNRKHKTTAMVCRYVMRTKIMSGRALARQLGVHHTTWNRYARGETRPDKRIKAQLVSMMKLENFTELIQIAFRESRRIHYKLR